MPILKGKHRFRTSLKAIVLTAFSTLAFAGTALAEIRTLEIPLAMTCPMSEPPLFKELLLGVKGTQTVEISYELQTAVVTYEDTEASPDDFLNALRDFLPTIAPEAMQMEENEEGMEGM